MMMTVGPKIGITSHLAEAPAEGVAGAPAEGDPFVDILAGLGQPLTVASSGDAPPEPEIGAGMQENLTIKTFRKLLGANPVATTPDGAAGEDELSTSDTELPARDDETVVLLTAATPPPAATPSLTVAALPAAPPPAAVPVDPAASPIPAAPAAAPQAIAAEAAQAAPAIAILASAAAPVTAAPTGRSASALRSGTAPAGIGPLVQAAAIAAPITAAVPETAAPELFAQPELAGRTSAVAVESPAVALQAKAVFAAPVPRPDVPAAPSAPADMAAPSDAPAGDPGSGPAPAPGPAPALAPIANSLLSAAPPATPAQAPLDPGIAAAGAGEIFDPAVEQQLDLAHEGEWLDRLARDIARSSGTEGGLRFRLNPETLGSLHVELNQGQAGASLRLTAETEAARAILADAQPRLMAEARAQGVRIAETHVDLGGGHASASGEQRRQGEERPTAFVRTDRERAAREGEAPETVLSASERYA